MTKITHRTNLTLIVKIVNLETSQIYSCNHMVEMNKISYSVKKLSHIFILILIFVNYIIK